ncbi:MAG: response regulator transcription factor, partial [Acidimicrobiia bacterium]|nr:response regulator transcription factor [Acidimicrobiia bacterium]
MQQRRPPQAVAFVGVEVHLLGDELAEGADPFGVSPGLSIVHGEPGRQDDHVLRCGGGILGTVAGAQRLDPFLEALDRPGAQCQPRPRRRAVGEGERELQQRYERKEALEQADHAADGDHRYGERGDQPQRPELVCRAGDQPAQGRRGRNAHDERKHEDGCPQHKGESPPGLPTRAGRTCRSGHSRPRSVTTPTHIEANDVATFGQLPRRQVAATSVATALVIDSDSGIRGVVASQLKGQGYEVAEASTASEGMERLEHTRPDLVLVDVDVPDGDGFELLPQLRRATDAPVIVITARAAETDRIAGLDLGADDYVVKPLSIGELMARVRAVSRRVRPGSAEGGLRFGDLLIDRRSREVQLRDQRVVLTHREFDLLAYLASSPGQVFSRDQLLDQVWGSSSAWQDSKTVTEHIRRLRQKLNDAVDGTEWIRTVHGVGYAFSGSEAAG